MYTKRQIDFLKSMTKYIWWESVEESLARPQRILAQVMELGTTEDIADVIDLFSEEALTDILKNAESGWFSARSWNFWHFRLNLAKKSEDIPPMKKRSFFGA
jgi:hypothetical protein